MTHTTWIRSLIATMARRSPLATLALGLAFFAGGAPGAGPQPIASTGGYWMVAADGGVFAFGDAAFLGPKLNPDNDIAAMAATPSGAGYWTVDDDGDVYAYGEAANFGSRQSSINDITAFAARPAGDGYWMASERGGIFAFGTAPFLGSLGHLRLNQPIVAMAATPSGNGYWLVATDGGIFSFGDAAFFGSTGHIRLNRPIVGMASTPTGKGYWLVASDGGIFAFGDAGFYGSTGAIRLNQAIVAMAATPSGNGYWLVASDGGVFAFGDAGFFGSTGNIRLNQPIVGMIPSAPDPHLGGASNPDPDPVNPPADAVPSATDDAATLDEDTSVTVDVTANDAGLGNRPVAVAVTSAPTHGTTMILADGRITYRPEPDYHGSDAFTYRVTDADGDSDTAVVALQVRAVNDAPTTQSTSLTLDEDTSVEGTITAADADGDDLAYTVATSPARGDVDLDPDGSFTYTSDANASGTDSFTIRVSDGSASASAVVGVTIRAENDPPAADDDSYSTVEDEVLVVDAPGVLNGDTDPDPGAALSAVPVAGPAHGAFTLNANGSFTYSPEAHFNGIDSFIYKASDGASESNVASVTIHVIPINDTPVAVADEAWANEGSTNVSIDVLANDSGLTDVPLLLTTSTLSPSAAGTMAVDTQADVVIYNPAPSFSGVATFTYTVRDADGQSAGARVTIHVEPAGTTPSDVEVISPDDDLLVGSRLVFSTVNEEARPGKTLVVRNTGFDPLVVSGLSISGPQAALFQLGADQVTSFTLDPAATATVSVEFRPIVQDKAENYATLAIISDRGTYTVDLAGLNAHDYENGVEPSVAQLSKLLGYKSTIGPLGRTRLPSGEELISQFWRAADPAQPVRLLPLAAFSGRKTYETGMTGWYPKGSPTTVKNKLFGIPGGTDVSGGQNQRLRPEINVGGTTTFAPDGVFGLYSENDWSDDGRNGSAKIHNFRFWPAEGPDGNPILDAWVVAWDYNSDASSTSKNYDYQDGMYLLVNAAPELTSAPPPGDDATHLVFSVARPDTVGDGDGEGTGFTGVQANTPGDHYQPFFIDLDTDEGVLGLTSTRGVGSNGTNTQQNALEIGYDGSLGDVRIHSRLVGPFTEMDATYDLQGVYFGPDQNNFVKLEIEHRGDGVYLTLWFEQNGGGALPVNPLKLPPAASLDTIDLFLTADLAAGAVGGSYRINSDDPAAIQSFGPQVFPSDVMRWFSVQARAGVLVANQNNLTSFTGRFDQFNIDGVAAPASALAWSNSRGSPVLRHGAQGAAVDGKLYVFGGYTSTTPTPSTRGDVYNAATNAWSSRAALPQPIAHGATAVDGRSIYLAGGYPGNPDGTQTWAIADVYRYDIDTNIWSGVTPLPAARGAGALVRLGRQLHFFGGADIDRIDKGDHWILDLDDPTAWTPAVALPNARSHMGYTAYAGRIYAIGGSRGIDAATAMQATVHTWDPAFPNTWIPVANLPSARAHVGVVELDGRLVVLGGESRPGTATTAVVSYDSQSNTWRSMTKLPAARHSGVAGVLDGAIHYTGGNLTSGNYRGQP